MARKTAAEAEQTRKCSIAAAFDVFVCQTAQDTALEQVVRKEGVTRGAAYWHFKGKHDVLQAVLSSRQHPLELDFLAGLEIGLAWETMVAATVEAVHNLQFKQFSEILSYQGIDGSGATHSRLNPSA